MDKSYAPWQELNATISYPLQNNSDIPTSTILDACLFFAPPVNLVKIRRNETVIKFYINKNVQWSVPLTYDHTVINGGHVYNDFGKLVLGDLSWITAMAIGSEISLMVPFEESVCYYQPNLLLMGLDGDVELSGDVDVVDQTLQISFKETSNFTHEGLSSINGQAIIDQSLVLAGDKCTQVKMREGYMVIDDICLPPCYDCNARLTTGDVNLRMAELEAKVDLLE